MILRINGETREVPPLESVAALVAHLGTPPATLLVEHNGIALRRTEWDRSPLADGDVLEFLQIAAGG